MKKRFALIAVLVIVGTLIAPLAVGAQAAPAAAPAEEPEKLKVYYSEPIGAGKKVYHITSCKKEPVQAPLRCDEANADVFVNQCKKGDKVAAGTLIRGCHTKAPADATKAYPLTKPEAQLFKPDPKNPSCAEGKEELYYYGQQYAIVSQPAGSSEDSSKWTYKDSVSWDSADVPPEVIAKLLDMEVSDMENLPDPIRAVPLYRATLCVSWDFIDSGDELELEDPELDDGSLTKELFDDATPMGITLAGLGCNNDNSTAIDGVEVSTPYNQVNSIHCSISERIEGRTGSELFGNYISALYRWAASIVGIIGVLILVASGIQISIAGGDTAKIDEAKQRIMQSLIGIAILFLSGLILYTINPGFFTG